MGYEPPKEDEDDLPEQTVSAEAIREAQERAAAEARAMAPDCPACGWPLDAEGNCTNPDPDGDH